jgi:phage terminase Nu1 subunit (DNA packaging protein)
MILTRFELAEKLKVTTQTIINFEKRGMPTLRGKGAPRYDWDDVKKWMEQKTEEK